MRKIAVFILCFAIIFCIVGCNKFQNEVTTSEISSVSQSQITTEATSESKLSTEKETEFSIKQSVESLHSTTLSTTKVIEKQDAETMEKPSEAQKTTYYYPTSKTETATKVTTIEKPAPPAEQPIDIDYYINFATNYAQSIGLTIDKLATDCWDNPISITSKTTNAEINITSRLDRYKNIEGFSSVCIWCEKVGENSFEIYIGYA